jgi:hypothetical protein
VSIEDSYVGVTVLAQLKCCGQAKGTCADNDDSTVFVHVSHWMLRSSIVTQDNICFGISCGGIGIFNRGS